MTRNKMFSFWTGCLSINWEDSSE